ncbi:MAG TPA: glycosyltransferase family 1 protein, partial [Solirubrobacteraceae bacterium]|nr:glycosyltransferase family 1 protein [Solirubrobacteraceae bacterium]
MDDASLPRVAVALATLVPGRIGGSETYVRGLLGALAGDPGAKRVTVLAGRTARRVVPPQLAVRAVLGPLPAAGPARAAALSAGLVAARALGSGAPPHDVLHVPLTVPIPRTGAPVALTLHDVNHHDLPHLFTPAERAFRRWAYDAPAKRAAVVLTPSEHTRGRAIARLGLDPARIVAVHHGIDHDRVRPRPHAADEAALAALPPLPNRFALYPAVLLPHKDHETLLRALARLADRDLALMLTGHRDDGRWATLRAMASELGIGARVHHLGNVPEEALAPLMRRATVLAFPSRYEGFGLPVAEAMACGLPVVAAEAAAIPEVAGGAAHLVAPGDDAGLAAALDALGAGGTQAARLRAAGLRRAAA